MKVIIEIPDKDIPKQQDTMSVNFIFTAGCPCQCDYPFDVIKESDDCVSRQAVLDLAKFDGRENLGSIIHAFDVEQLPPVKPAEKVGHWIEVTNGRGGHECDLCHNYAPSYQSGDEYLSKHCPNCGAKMQEVSRHEK